MQIPGGWAAQLYGGRIMLIICFILWSLVSFFTPSDAKNTWLIIVARVCIGVAQGFLIPSVHTVLSQVRGTLTCAAGSKVWPGLTCNIRSNRISVGCKGSCSKQQGPRRCSDRAAEGPLRHLLQIRGAVQLGADRQCMVLPSESMLTGPAAACCLFCSGSLHTSVPGQCLSQHQVGMAGSVGASLIVLCACWRGWC